MTAAKEMLEGVGLHQDPSFLMALEAVLEVLPPSRSFTGFDPVEAAAPAASDFEVLEGLRRLCFGDEVDEPKQLSMLHEEAAQ
ncbi:hypothetical protein [Caenispirillum salinarum]|uniref:hypothetical protein n=1 Tax=Caenispirillum salinarum TaxID=859058 RepID=UPI003850F81B